MLQTLESMGQKINERKLFMAVVLACITLNSCRDTSRCHDFIKYLRPDDKDEIECKEKGKKDLMLNMV